MLTFRDTESKFEIQGDLLRMIFKKKYNLDLANLPDKKLMYEFAKELYFDEKAPGKKGDRDISIKKILISHAIMASGNSTPFLSSDSNKLCERIHLLLKKKQVGNNTDKVDKEIIAIFDKFLEYKCISTKTHDFLRLKCLNKNYEVDQRTLKSDYIQYSPAENSTISTPNSQTKIKYLVKILLLVCWIFIFV